MISPGFIINSKIFFKFLFEKYLNKNSGKDDVDARFAFNQLYDNKLGLFERFSSEIINLYNLLEKKMKLENLKNRFENKIEDKSVSFDLYRKHEEGAFGQIFKDDNAYKEIKIERDFLFKNTSNPSGETKLENMKKYIEFTFNLYEDQIKFLERGINDRVKEYESYQSFLNYFEKKGEDFDFKELKEESELKNLKKFLDLLANNNNNDKSIIQLNQSIIQLNQSIIKNNNIKFRDIKQKEKDLFLKREKCFEKIAKYICKNKNYKKIIADGINIKKNEQTNQINQQQINQVEIIEEEKKNNNSEEANIKEINLYSSNNLIQKQNYKVINERNDKVEGGKEIFLNKNENQNLSSLDLKNEEDESDFDFGLSFDKIKNNLELCIDREKLKIEREEEARAKDLLMEKEEDENNIKEGSQENLGLVKSVKLFIGNSKNKIAKAAKDGKAYIENMVQKFQQNKNENFYLQEYLKKLKEKKFTYNEQSKENEQIQFLKNK